MITNSGFLKPTFSNNSKILQALFLTILVVFDKTNPMAIVFAYVFETIIIGVLNVVKLFLVSWHTKNKNNHVDWQNFLLIPFFILHFGFFVIIQTVFIYLGFAIYDESLSTSLNFKNYAAIFELKGFLWVAFSIVLTNLMGFCTAFLQPKSYKNQQANVFFLKPYLRIFVQQFLAIVPFLFLVFTNEVGKVAALLLIGMRLGLDFYFNTIANNPDKIKKLAKRIMNKEKPEELPQIEMSLKVFFEE
uniref:DUF6498-containing protein n=1 Tax=Flavobacterium sp. TaxID=239 RepID=UPI00404ADB41